MSIINLRKKPLFLKDVSIDVIGDEQRLVMMRLETVDHKNVVVGMPPEVAVAMLEDLSTTTLRAVKRNRTDEEVMYR